MYKKRLRNRHDMLVLATFFSIFGTRCYSYSHYIQAASYMKTFRLKIPDSCYTISKGISVKTLLFNHKWFVLGENGYEDMLTFQRNGALLIYLNEKETKAYWAYNTQTNSLAFRDIKNTPRRALRPFFWDSYLLVFKLHTLDEYLFLVNADKAYKLLINPLDCFEKYAEGALERLKNSRRRKPVKDEDEIILMDLKPLSAKDIKQMEINLQESASAEDPKKIVTIYPGPIALEAKPVEYPVKKAKPAATSQPEDILAPDLDERIQQALQNQQKELDKKWNAKLEAATEKLNAALWVEKNDVERRINKALREQAHALDLQHRKHLREQKLHWKTQELKVRERWMGKVKQQVERLRKNKDRDVEIARLAEQGRHQFEVQTELRKQRKIYDIRINALIKKATDLESELILIKMERNASNEISEEKVNEQIEIIKQHLSDSTTQYQELEKQMQDFDNERKDLKKQVQDLNSKRMELEKQVQILNDKLQAEKKKYFAEMNSGNEKYLSAITIKEKDSFYVNLYKRQALSRFRNLWDCHMQIADYNINPKLKEAMKKEPSHISYCRIRNILLSVILFLATFLCLNDTIMSVLEDLCFKMNLPFISSHFWGIVYFVISGVMMFGITFLTIFTMDYIENRKEMKKKLYKIYLEEFLLSILEENYTGKKET